MSAIKVAVGIPTEGHSPAEAMFNRLLMAFHLGRLERGQEAREDAVRFEFYWKSSGRLFTPMAREKLVESALAEGMDYIFMIDDDMLAPQDVIERLYRHDVDLCAALAFTRNPPHLPVLYTIQEGWDPILKREYVRTEWIRNYPKDRLVECDAVGFGAVLIKTSLIRRMRPPYFMSTCGLGEDILFCVKAKREANARIFMDTTVNLGHMGAPIIVDEERSAALSEPAEMARLYGPYRRYQVYDVAHCPDQGYDGLRDDRSAAEIVLAGA